MLILLGYGLAAAAFSVAAAALPALERRAHRQGLVDLPGGRKQHGGALPLTGGIAVLLAVSLPVMGGLLLALSADLLGGLVPEALSIHLPGIRSKAPALLAILAGTGIHLLLGHLDDRRGLSPWTRLGVEVATAAGLAALDIRLTAFLPWEWAHWALTVVFVVFVTNAVNFIDNMNGLMGGTVLIAALNLLALAAASGQLFLAAILCCLAGGLLAFLRRNFPEARVIMGDAGSLPLGFLLAAITIEFTFSDGGAGAPPSLAIALPLLVLALPVYDGLTVIGRRLARGVHPFTAGRDHVSHRLLQRGFGPVRTVLCLWTAAWLAGIVPALLLAGPLTVAAVWFPAMAAGGVLLPEWSRGRDR